MASYLNIPGVTEAEDLLSYSMGTTTNSVNITIAAGETAMWLFRAASDGQVTELMVIMGEGGVTLALDNVYVSSASFSGGSAAGGEAMTCTLDASEIRVIP